MAKKRGAFRERRKKLSKEQVEDFLGELTLEK